MVGPLGIGPAQGVGSTRYARGPMEQHSAATMTPSLRTRTGAALRRRHNWEQLVKFCVVGASGYAVNLAVYTLLLDGANLHYALAATGSFLVAVTNNYTWNRLWTFRHQRGHFGYQGLRFLIVSATVYAANLALLSVLVSAGLGEIVSQAIAVVLVTPLNFLGNKLWSFRGMR
jgi:putative flippase GtrA